MAMNDEETVALIAGGHTLRQDPRRRRRRATSAPSPKPLRCEQMGLGWKSSYGTGIGDDTIASGLEGAWTPTPVTWDNSYFETLFGYEWDLTKSPAGALAVGSDGPEPRRTPCRIAHDPAKRHSPVMLTTDLALRMDPIYEPISRRFLENPEELADAFAKAWFKLTHRDMGPITRYLGPLVPAEPQIWQDPVPPVDHPLVDEAQDVAALKAKILASGLSVAAAGLDRVGLGVDLPRHRQARRRQRRPDPAGAAEGLGGQRAGRSWPRCCATLETIQQEFNDAAAGGKRISLADLIVLGGCAGRREGREGRRRRRRGAVHPGAHRRDAGADRRRVVRRARADRRRVPQLPRRRPAEARRAPAGRQGEPAHAHRARDDGARGRPARARREPRRVGARRAHRSAGDADQRLLRQPASTWARSGSRSDEAEETFEGRDRATGEARWTASRVDLVFGSNSQLRAIAEVYASDDAQEKFVRDFVAAWDKVMKLDRFDIA